MSASRNYKIETSLHKDSNLENVNKSLLDLKGNFNNDAKCKLNEFLKKSPKLKKIFNELQGSEDIIVKNENLITEENKDNLCNKNLANESNTWLELLNDKIVSLF